MKPTHKAKELIHKFKTVTGGNECYAKSCALMCVEEIRNGITNNAHGAAWDLDTLEKKEDFWNKVEVLIKHMSI